jgi:hypothetical protein
MRLLTIAFILTFHFTIAFGQVENSPTELIIIGTIHNGNKLFNHKTLFEVLKKNKPDIILWEQSIKFKRIFGLSTANFLNLERPGIEQLSLQKYSRFNKKVQILPYDTLIPSRNYYLENLIAVKQTFHDNLFNAKKTISDSTIYENYAKKYNFYVNFIDTSTLSRINQNDVVEMSRKLYYLEENAIFPLGKKYITDSLLVDEFYDEIQFWNARNKYMVNQIIKYTKQFAGKKIIVLTGLNHKYYLQDKLKGQKKTDVRITEFLDN